MMQLSVAVLSHSLSEVEAVEVTENSRFFGFVACTGLPIEWFQFPRSPLRNPNIAYIWVKSRISYVLK